MAKPSWDNTMLDFFYMMTKLCVKLCMVILQSHQLDFKSHASGYTHTYKDSKHINLAALLQYPTDVEIQDAAKEAMDETDSLFILLGVNVSILQAPAGTRTQLPSINSWLLNHQTTDKIEIDNEYDDLNDNDDEDDTQDEVTRLQAYMNLCQNGLSLPHKQFEKVTRLACTAAALIADDMGWVYVSNTSPWTALINQILFLDKHCQMMTRMRKKLRKSLQKRPETSAVQFYPSLPPFNFQMSLVIPLGKVITHLVILTSQHS